MSYQDPVTNEKFIPFCIEPSLGADRVTLAFLVEAYDEQTIEGANGKEDTRTVLHFHPALAPYKAAVLPLTKNRRRKPKNSETSWRSISLWITIFRAASARDTEDRMRSVRLTVSRWIRIRKTTAASR